MEGLDKVRGNSRIVRFPGLHWNLAVVKYEAGVPAAWVSKIAVGSAVELHLFG